MSQQMNPMKDRWPGEQEPPTEAKKFTPGRTIPLKRPTH